MPSDLHPSQGTTCTRCGAWRGELGSEPVPDCLAWARQEPPCAACYVCHLRVIFAAVWRVLRDDGTLWLNLGDSYVANAPGNLKPRAEHGNGDGRFRLGGAKQSEYLERNRMLRRSRRVEGQRMRLRADLTPEQRAYVLTELAKVREISDLTQDGR